MSQQRRGCCSTCTAFLGKQRKFGLDDLLGGHTGSGAGTHRSVSAFLKMFLLTCAVSSCVAGGDAGNAGTRRHRAFASCRGGRVLHGESVASSEKSIHGAGYSSEWSFRRVFA